MLPRQGFARRIRTKTMIDKTLGQEPGPTAPFPAKPALLSPADAETNVCPQTVICLDFGKDRFRTPPHTPPGLAEFTISPQQHPWVEIRVALWHTRHRAAPKSEAPR
jgi:hypothetical protein